MTGQYLKGEICRLLPARRQSVNTDGEMIVVVELSGHMPIVANLSRLSEPKLQELASMLGVKMYERH